MLTSIYQGLCLALCLRSRSIQCSIYEQRAEPFNQGGSIALFPNGLSILDSLHLYRQIHQAGFDIEDTVTKDETYTTVFRSKMSNAKLYGYKVLRVRRDAVVRVLISSAEQQGIQIYLNRKFMHVVSEHAESVTFELDGGERRTATLLVGADGIHSRVRRGFPDAPSPVYHGQAGLAWTLPKDNIRFPAGEDARQLVRLKTPGGIVLLVPDRVNGDAIRVGLSVPIEDRNRVSWEKLAANKKQLLILLEKLYTDAPDVLQSFIEGAKSADISLWPIRSMATAPSWVSECGKVIILGDAAHALPPSGGQGGSMGIEDAYSLAFALSSSLSTFVALKRWQKMRKERLDKVVEYIESERRSRLPSAQPQDRLNEDDERLNWLYAWKPETHMRDWEEFKD